MSTIAVIRTFADTVSDPDRLRQDLEAGVVIELSDVGYTLAPSSAVIWVGDDYDENEEMVSLRSDVTGVENVVFVSPRGRTRHGPRIKIAIDPPQSLDPSTKTASMSITDFSIHGERMPRQVAEQAEQFIDRNRAALMAYWNYEIDTAELIKRLQRP
jgi:hypothetical protein